MSLQSQDYLDRSATNGLTPAPNARAAGVTEVAKLIDVSVCTGCKACQVACSEWNDLREEVGVCDGTYNNPPDLSSQSWTVMKFTEHEDAKTGKLEWLIRKEGCMHCSDPGCLKACPSPGAIVKHANGIVDFISENCIGCGYCVTGCPFNVPRLSRKDNRAYKCTLCSDRLAVGQEPACVKTCATGAIKFGTKQDMIEYAATRVEDLKTRGYPNAALYNPKGVGGTHVMYVLPHGDHPEWYGGLPANPQVPALTRFWKNVFKPVATAGLIATVAVAALHYLKVGPVEPEEEEKEASHEH